MRTIETTVYKFAELSDKAQERALEKLYDINVSDSFWYEFDIAEFLEILNMIGLDTTEKDIEFSGFSSQGDGLSFTGHYSYSKNALKKIMAKFPTWTEVHADLRALQEIQRRNFYRISGDIYRINHYYCHENTVKFEGVMSATLYSVGFENKMTEIFRSIAREFYSTLSKNYDYYTSRNCIIETIELNEYEFDIDGDLI